jgi:ATP-binding protein involved in chromosome partitioning
MRFAIPITGGTISQHFGHCEQFALLDTDDGKKEVIKKQIVASPGHQPGFLPGWLAQQGVSVIIAGGMGSQAQILFDENNIKTVTGIAGDDLEKIVKEYMQGKLETGNNTCNHDH